MTYEELQHEHSVMVCLLESLVDEVVPGPFGHMMIPGTNDVQLTGAELNYSKTICQDW